MMKNKHYIIQKTLFFLILHCFLITALANPIEKAVGWHWYNEPHPKKTEKIKNTSQKTLATQQMTAVKFLVKESLDKAVLYPTEQNIRTYLILQNYLTQHAAFFSQLWQKTLLDYPTLDFGVEHPTENDAQPILYSQEDQAEQAAIDADAKTDGLFFFYRGKNALDQAFAPTVKAFSTQNNISLIPISVDGTTLPIFAHNQLDQGQALKLGIHVFPALVLVNPATKKVQPIHYGFASQDELRNRFLEVASQFRQGA